MRRILALAVCVAATAGGAVRAAGAQDADTLFAHGQLAPARAAYMARLARRHGDVATEKALGLIALWGNRLDEAAARLVPLVARDSSDTVVADALAETWYRQRRFVAASVIDRRRGRVGQAGALDVAGASAFVTTVPAGGTRVEFPIGTSSPVLRVSINGHDSYLILDTGAEETLVDSGLAASIGIQSTGTDTAFSAGGIRRPNQFGVADSIVIGGAVVRHPVVTMMNVHGLFADAQGHQVDGLLGLSLLMQFRVTIDYARHTVTLAPRGGRRAAEAGTSVLPLWLVTDHKPVIPAVALGRDTTLVILDTGLGGTLFAPGPTLLRTLHVTLGPETGSSVGIGGAVREAPFAFDVLAVGPIAFTSLPAVAGVFPATGEDIGGVRLGGLLAGFFFTGRSITLDFDAMKLVVGPPGSK
jgi:hypothetical protein